MTKPSEKAAEAAQVCSAKSDFRNANQFVATANGISAALELRKTT
jgi:hypothetical protein